MAEVVRQTCSRGHPIPPVSSMLRAFGLQDPDVLNIYLVGSHLWKTCHASSDWDLVIIVRELSSVKPLNHHKGNIEAFIVSKEHYLEQIDSHSLQLTLTVWLPKECVLRELFNPRNSFRFSLPTLVSALEQHKERDFRISRKHFIKHDQKKAKKILLHFIRYLELGIQIKSAGCITDYGSANQHRETVLDTHCEEWCELLEVVGPIVDQLWSSLLS